MLVRQECLAILEPIVANLAELSAAGDEYLQQVYGARCLDLIEIALETAHNLRRLTETIPPDGTSIADDDAMRDLRHDLRGPVGTLRNAIQMLLRRTLRPEDPLVQLATTVGVAAEEMRDIVEALTEDVERD
jgi:signal transduction histidine kinase